jgi:hypothetical protein
MRPAERTLFGLAATEAGQGAAGAGTAPTAKPKRSLALATYFFRVPRAYLPMLGHFIISMLDYGVCIRARHASRGV